VKLLPSLLMVVACGGGGSSPPDAPRAAACTAELEAALDRSCAAPAECVLVGHGDCCGTVLLGIRGGTELAFPAIETTFQTCRACPPSGCAHADLAEDGSTAGSGQAIVADCIAMRCASVVR